MKNTEPKVTKPKRKPASLYSLRPAQRCDFALIDLMCAQAAMPTPKDYLAGTVAVNDKDQPVGYIRVLLIEDDLNPKGLGAYIYPVVVFEGWRQYGIASALVDYELERHGALKLVACKASRGFYQRTGWETEDWDNIAALISRDCELCPDCQTCDPQPFRKSQA